MPLVAPVGRDIVDDDRLADALDRMVAEAMPGILTWYEDDTLVLPIGCRPDIFMIGRPFEDVGAGVRSKGIT